MSEPALYLVPVDFSDATERSVEFARTLAASTGARIVYVHVRPIADLRAAVLEDRGDLLQGDREKLSSGLAAHYGEKLARLVTDAERESTKLLVGIPSQEICNEARRGGYQLVVAGPRGRGGVMAALLGSTTQALLARASIPVVVVPMA